MFYNTHSKMTLQIFRFAVTEDNPEEFYAVLL